MAICARPKCGKKFAKVVPWKKFCSRECMLLNWAGKNLEKKEKGAAK